MYVVALTGGIGSGKSTVSKLFAALGVPIVDLDAIAHQLTAAQQPIVKKIAAVFGGHFIADDGGLNRDEMRQLIFNDEAAREKLNAILHPAIYNQAIDAIQAQVDAPYVILEIPLLWKDSNYHKLINRVLVVDCDVETQIKRVKQRSQLSEIAIKQIIDAQPSKRSLLEMADDVLKNDGNVEKLREKIVKLHRKYIKTCIVSKTIS